MKSLQLRLTFHLFISCFSLFFSAPVFSQVTLAFQGGEPGDTWTYNSSAASALAQSEALLAPNKVTGTRSLVAGGTTGGGNCWAGGSGNGTTTAHTFTFNAIDISSSNESVRTLSINWGNRFPACNGTGWDSGENLVFTAYHDGVAQPSLQLATGASNAQFSIQANQHVHQIPTCVNSFSFVISVSTNRADELLFIDNVTLTAPQLNATTTIPLTISGPTSLCTGETITLTSNYASGNSWSTGENTPSIDINTPGTYTLTMNTACGTVSDEHIVTASSSTVAEITPNGPTVLCTGETVTLTSSSPTGNSWSTGETTESIVVSTAGTITLTVTDACGASQDSEEITVQTPPDAQIAAGGPLSFCSGDSVLLTASGGDTYVWSNGETDAAIYVSAAGNYFVTATNDCGSDVSSAVTVSILPNPSAQITGNASFCESDSLLLTASGGDAYLWSNGETDAAIYVHASGNYPVTATNSCGQSVSAAHMVNMLPLPQAQITGDANFCAGQSATLTATGGLDYLWSNGETTATINVTTPGNYTVTAINSCGQDISAPFTVTQLSLPNAQITGDLIFCTGEFVVLTANGGSNYQWSSGEQTATITVSTAGSYTVTAINTCGQDQETVNVIESIVEADFTANPLSGTAPLLVSFNGPSGDAYQWDFGDGETASGSDPQHLFTDVGVYTVTLTATNAHGCSATTSLDITVVSFPSTLVVPNVFTPNGDGTNDLFSVTSENLESYHLQLFNRWGNVVLEVDSPNACWDGTVNGDPANEGTYYYKIEATGMDQKEYKLSGFFDLIR